jgi:putative ABC transport system permease protein
LYGLAELKLGISQLQMEDEMKAFEAQWAREHKDDPSNVMTLRVLDLVNQAIRPTLLLLLGASAALLLIACANVASLLLARAVGGPAIPLSAWPWAQLLGS